MTKAQLLRIAERCSEAKSIGEIMSAEREACSALSLPLVRHGHGLDELAQMLQDAAEKAA